MPSATMGEKTALDSQGLFIQLEAKDQQFQLRFISGDYHYDGKHFMRLPDGKWDVSDCPRINEDLHCVNCERYFELMEPAKDLKKALKEAEANDDEGEVAKLEKQIKKIKDQAEPYKAKVSFYYIVLERGERASHKAKIFKTTIMVRKQLEGILEMGQAVLGRDFIVRRTEVPGSYYTTLPVDSAETPELTEDEKLEIEKAQNWNLADKVNGKKGSGSLEQEPEEDIPLPPEEGR